MVNESVLKAWESKTRDHSWKCGFCGQLLTTWDVRAKHIAKHFRDGFTMDNWSSDPFHDNSHEVLEGSVLNGHSQQSNVNQNISLDSPLVENGVRNLKINDHSPSAIGKAPSGMKNIKRRASSSPVGDHACGSWHDLYYRDSVQVLATNSCNSPTGYQSRSYASSSNLPAAGSVTSFGGEFLSPVRPPTPLGEPELGSRSPYVTSRNVKRYPSSSLSKPPQQRIQSDASEIPYNSAMNSVGSHVAKKVQPFYVCDCCPKKPKKFDSKEELE